MGLKLDTNQILEAIYGGGLDEQSFAMMIRKIYQALDDSFYEDPPSLEQQKILKDLLKIADQVENFYK